MNALRLTLLSLAAGLLAQSSVLAATFTFTFTGDEISGSGEFTTADTTSPYLITGVSGTVSAAAVGSGTFTITSLSDYASPDQVLTYPSDQYVSLSGISFVTDTGGSFNIASQGPNDYVVASSFLNPGGEPGGSLYHVTLSITAAGGPSNPGEPSNPGGPSGPSNPGGPAAPELSTWAMLGLGFLGLSFVGRKRGRAVLRAL